ncbi:hypothetical protein EGH22_19235 [Halomicroarcula sp. F28]|uniref:hypothetical protein n=1 Tax=Haloarcula salinisoli TaxID=2487746 RepID=UPI001C72DC9B|nr:hypothetical protein [Halomicroarcula salinisoli]MBX0288469.1 hypothetical protein [Halomicroarcula salinisoli]
MEQATKHYLTATISATLGVLMLVGGGVFAVDAYGTMGQIEAQGLLGQAAYEQEYEQAVTNLQISVAAILFGFFLTLTAIAEDINKTLWKLNEE